MTEEHGHIEDPTREKLLDAAEKLFAEKGFDAVSVREITKAAGVNLGAINYHFGGKKDLYLSVFRQRWLPRARRMRQPLLDLAASNPSDPETAIRLLTRNWMNNQLSTKERYRHGQLILREFVNPTEALRMVIDNHMAPLVEEGVGLLRKVMAPDTSTEKLKLSVLSIFSQIVYFSSHRTLISLVAGREYDPEFIERIVDHITEFTLMGLGLKGKVE